MSGVHKEHVTECLGELESNVVTCEIITDSCLSVFICSSVLFFNGGIWLPGVIND